jgi:hypothetical protein
VEDAVLAIKHAIVQITRSARFLRRVGYWEKVMVMIRAVQQRNDRVGAERLCARLSHTPR